MARTASGTFQIAVLSSGHSRGSNLAAMHAYWQKHELPIQIALAVFNREDSSARKLATDLGIPTAVVSTKQMASYEAELTTLCHAKGIQLIALAGFLKQLSAEFLSHIGIPVLNIHPALLPKYGGKGMYGMSVHQAVWQAGEAFSGATVHLVDQHYDNGSIIASAMVDISACRSPEDIAQRVLQQEHKLYAPSIYSFLTGLEQ